MKSKKIIPAFFALALCSLILKSLFDHSVPAYTFPHWEHGAPGYELALKKAEAKESPLIVYFHASSCSWCKKLENNYLATEKGEEFLRNILKVEINTDKGEAERILFNKYRLRGTPSFLVFIPKLKSPPVLISPFLSAGNLTVDEFLHEIKNEIDLAYKRG
ncbi:MAG: thioredoxin family protein [Deltaproteobacteria bacterium]|nr:thioredoxin family protein [Deltaproteobacteria bacterium]